MSQHYYKYEALEDIRFLCLSPKSGVNSEQIEELKFWEPEWVSMKKGDKKNLGILLGFHPDWVEHSVNEVSNKFGQPCILAHPDTNFDPCALPLKYLGKLELDRP